MAASPSAGATPTVPQSSTTPPAGRLASAVPPPELSAPPPLPDPSYLDIIPKLSALLARLDTAPSSADPDPNQPPPLSAKDLPAATDDMKSKLHKARKQILALPGMDVSVAEQQAEIKELEAKIKAQKGIFERLRRGGTRGGIRRGSSGSHAGSSAESSAGESIGSSGEESGKDASSGRESTSGGSSSGESDAGSEGDN